MRGVLLPDEPSVAPPRGLPEEYINVVLDAVLLALSEDLPEKISP